ncbi:putative quinol monooxygenase [Bacillus sp. JJ1609]|uniref:putative quinol monooxygenase n=1 Tax=Bacillus sp. JJ1609 TaxID=3122977 RepID=UPI002FFE53C9
MIIIHAGFQVKADQEKEFLKEVQSLVEASRAEEGNISYDLLKDSEKAGSYTMVELWKDMDAVQNHNQAEHFTNFMSKAPQFMAAPADVKLFNAEPIRK